jgi:hypothetical protein
VADHSTNASVRNVMLWVNCVFKDFGN